MIIFFKDPLLSWFSNKADPERRTCDEFFIFKMVPEGQNSIPWSLRQKMTNKEHKDWVSRSPLWAMGACFCLNLLYIVYILKNVQIFPRIICPWTTGGRNVLFTRSRVSTTGQCLPSGVLSLSSFWVSLALPDRAPRHSHRAESKDTLVECCQERTAFQRIGNRDSEGIQYGSSWSTEYLVAE